MSSARLREAINRDALSRELPIMVDQTIEPLTVSLWLRSPSDHARRLSIIDN
jgi:hypothetical protein